MTHDRSRRGPALAETLAWTSLALGAAALAAPERLGRAIGLADPRRHRDAVRAVGVREVAAGVGLLTGKRPDGWSWARVGGDAMDLALLAAAMREPGADRRRLAGAMLAVGGIAALDLAAARAYAGQAETAGLLTGERSRRFVHTVTVNRPRDELYGFWRRLSNLPQVMEHLERVEEIDGRRSRWRARGPGGTTFAWEAEITDDRPGERLAWRSLPGGDVENEGSVTFRDGTGGRGTVVTAEIRYVPPAGRLGTTIATLFGREPGQEVQEDLRRFKQMMEAGEIARADSSHGRLMHPAQPAA